MKHIYYFVIIFFVTSTYVSGQEFEDYHPFPYDSVFFEISTPHEDRFEALMPIVKSGNADDMLLPINNNAHWVDILKEQESFGIFPFVVPYKNWLGEVSYVSQEIRFVTAFKDTIKIRTDLLVNTSDTCEFKIGVATMRKLVVHCNNIVEEVDDEVKEYTFSVLDENSNPIDGGFGSTAYNVESFSFRISKENGILNTPAFYYFPYCEQYEYKDFAKNILDQSTLNAYKVFHQNPGDEIHSLYETNSPGVGIPNQTFYKTICVNETYDETLNRMIRISDVWSLKKYTTGGTSMSNPLVWHIIPNYEQIKDSLYLNDFIALNNALPNGLGNEFWEDGYFYNADSTYFEGVIDNDVLNINGDSLMVHKGLDNSDHTDYTFRLGHRFRYYNRQLYVGGEGSSNFFHKLVYTNINGEEWGTPYSDTFLLALEEDNVAPVFQLIFIDRRNAIQIKSEQFFESARIYDLNGNFVKYISSDELEHEISIFDLKEGVYVFLAWDGQKAHSIKFLK